MNSVLTAMLVVGLIGMVIGVVLAIASKVLFVKVDERVEIIHEMLPHFNCGACGTAGCSAFAEALVNGGADVARCKPSKPEAKEAIKDKLKEFNI